MQFNNRYSKSKSIGKLFTKPSLTDQQFKQECDIGFIVENYAKIGKPFDQTNASYVDCTSVKDYQNAMYLVAEANSNFESLPASERDRFGSVENYLSFICDEKHLKESYEKGYIDRSSVDLSDVYPEEYLPNDKENVNEGPTETPPVPTSEKSG